MTLQPQRQTELVTKLLEHITMDNDVSSNYYFTLCGRATDLYFDAKILLHDSFVTESQKVNYRRALEANGEIARGQWTIVLKFGAKNWQKFVKKTAEREVAFECLLKKPGCYPSFIPICSLPTIGKQTNYTITSKDLCGNSKFSFQRGGIKINHKKDGSTIMLVRLEERGFIPLYHYVIAE